jgi:predicted double-glycine peptidase
MRWQSLFALVVVPVLVLTVSFAAYGSEVTINADSGIRVKVSSFKEMHMARVVRQNYDFSCGSAAVATLLTYSYDKPTSEQQAFLRMYSVGDQPHIRKVGFSLLDMKKYLDSRGIHSDGYKVSVDQLQKLHIPVITLISPGGYNHFVVLRGWSGHSVIIADPALGLRRVSPSDLEAMWNGVIFVLRDQVPLARRHYNDPQDMRIVPAAFESSGMYYTHEGLTGFFLNQRGINEF